MKAKAENEVVNTCTSSAPPCLTAASILIPHTEKGGMVPLGTSVVTRCRHEAPDTSYTFHVVDRQADSYLWTTRVHRLLKKFNRVGLGVSAHAYYDSELHSTVTKFHDFLAMPFSGFYNIEGKTVCIEDQHKQGFIRWSFKSKEDYEFIARCAEVCVSHLLLLPCTPYYAYVRTCARVD